MDSGGRHPVTVYAYSGALLHGDRFIATVAERPLHRRPTTADADPDLLVPGSLVFQPHSGPPWT